MDKISGFGSNNTTGGIPVQPQVPHNPKIDQCNCPACKKREYVCSKGDIEYHEGKDSYMGVYEHEMHHIQEYQEIAAKFGLKILSSHIQINTEHCADCNETYATGGHAVAQFGAEIDGQTVEVQVTKDGQIQDPNIAKKLKDKQAGITSPTGEKEDKTKTDEKKKKDDDGMDYLIFGK